MTGAARWLKTIRSGPVKSTCFVGRVFGREICRKQSTVCDNRSERLRKNQYQEDPEHASIYGQKPENCSPAKRSGQCTSNDRTNCHWHQQASLKQSHEAAALSTSGEISNDTRSDGDRASATGTLQTTHNNERGIVSCLRETNTCSNEDQKGAAEGDAAAFRIRDGPP
ncbi:hypothetical protein WHR41_01556 [Cladosporium halotolerans]|uniref:Uncharacterized protein n=1 Tax=Cladosporium halotolerans TaxID=1052096 RepID=A0AB34L2A7_9PEZI